MGVSGRVSSSTCLSNVTSHGAKLVGPEDPGVQDSPLGPQPLGRQWPQQHGLEVAALHWAPPYPPARSGRPHTFLHLLAGRGSSSVSDSSLSVPGRKRALGKVKQVTHPWHRVATQVSGPQRLHCYSSHPSPLLRRGGSRAPAGRACGERAQDQAPQRAGERPEDAALNLTARGRGDLHILPGSQLTGQGDGNPDTAQTQNKVPAGRLCPSARPLRPGPSVCITRTLLGPATCKSGQDTYTRSGSGKGQRLRGRSRTG